MRKENLPKVYQNQISIDSPNQKVFYSVVDKAKVKQTPKKTTTPKLNLDDFKEMIIEDKIKFIMKNPKLVFDRKMMIKTKYETLDTMITGRKENYLITKENRLIPTKDIEDLKIIL